MGFQYVIDNAESISIERKQVVASTISRNGVVRTVARGPAAWRFEVKLPDGPRWSENRDDISRLEFLDRYTDDTISFSDTGQSWLVKYQGNCVNYAGFSATWTLGNNYITLTANPTITSGYKFKAGDFIQLGTGHVYTVAADCTASQSVVYLHRSIIDDSATNQAIRVAENCVWTVRCVQFPSWTIFQRDQIKWNGAFVFYESLV